MSLRHLLDDAARDLRYGGRILVRNPLFSAVAILSLALGIGGAASVFAVMNAVVLRTLPVGNPHQLFVAQKFTGTEQHDLYSWPSFTEVRDELRGRAEACAFTSTTGMQVRPDGRSNAPVDRGLVQLVSGEFFDVLAQRAQVGRLLQPTDNARLGDHPVAVISDAFWTRQYQRSPAVVGRQMGLNGTSFTIVGVAAPGFFGPILAVRNPDVWIPLMMQQEVRYASNASNSGDTDVRKPWPPQQGIEWLRVLLRVPSPDAAGAVASILTAQYQRDSMRDVDPANTERRQRIERQRVTLEAGARGLSFLRENLTRPLNVLLAMVGVLLVIACGNLASLLISRANARDREIAIRLAIGAGRGRLIRQLLAETVLLSLVGGAIGLLIAAWGRDALLSMFASSASTIDLDTGFDWRVVGFSIAVTVTTGVLAGLAPAVRGTRVPLAEAMKAQARSVGLGGRVGVLGKVLVGAQMAFCLLLLVIALLFTRSLQALLRIDVGYDRAQLLVARMDVRSVGYDDEQRQAMYSRLVERLLGIPGVDNASLSLNGPIGTGRRTSSLSVEGYTPARGEQLVTDEEIVTDRYFETVGLRIVSGRGFTAADRAPGSNTSIVNETMARRFFPDGDAVGKRWDYGGGISPKSPIIVGIVEDAKYQEVRGRFPNMVYHLAAAVPDGVLSNIEVRTSANPTTLAATLRRVIAEAEPALPVFDIVPLDERLHRGVSNDRLIANLTTAFSAVALLLACLGLYGTISYGVTRRVTELGVRMALGADRGDVLWLVIREASVLVVAGALVGIPLAFVAGRSVGSLLYGVGAVDPFSYAVACAALITVSGIASFLPAHRASRIDPMAALRKE